MRLTFATSDSLSVFLTALSAWLIVQAGYRHRRGELVAAAALVLGAGQCDGILGGSSSTQW